MDYDTTRPRASARARSAAEGDPVVGRRFRGRSGTGSSRRATAGIAGWSAPYRASTHEERRMVAAREARQAAVDRHRGLGWTLVTLSMIAVPGSRTPVPGVGALFAWAAREVARAFPDARRLGTFVDALGPFALWHTSTWWDSSKARCVALEASRPAARLVNLDVYSPEGAPVDRGSLLLAPRRCLCCDGPA